MQDFLDCTWYKIGGAAGDTGDTGNTQLMGLRLTDAFFVNFFLVLLFGLGKILFWCYIYFY